jgi:hypothetical protein
MLSMLNLTHTYQVCIIKEIIFNKVDGRNKAVTAN